MIRCRRSKSRLLIGSSDIRKNVASSDIWRGTGEYMIATSCRGAMRVLACALLLSGALGTAPASAWRYGVGLHEGRQFGPHLAGDHFGARFFAGGRSCGHLC